MSSLFWLIENIQIGRSVRSRVWKAGGAYQVLPSFCSYLSPLYLSNQNSISSQEIIKQRQRDYTLQRPAGEKTLVLCLERIISHSGSGVDHCITTSCITTTTTSVSGSRQEAQISFRCLVMPAVLPAHCYLYCWWCLLNLDQGCHCSYHLPPPTFLCTLHTPHCTQDILVAGVVLEINIFFIVNVTWDLTLSVHW